MKKTFFSFFLFMVGIYTGGCSINQEKPPEHIYDFGLAPQAVESPRIPCDVLVQDVSAPVWLATPALYYRLAYHDAARLQTYANSRWIAEPAALLTLRLRQKIGNSVHSNQQQYQLHLEIEEFSQVFDTPTKSRGVVRAKANLTQGDKQNLFASHVFTVEQKASSPDAEGGVRALSEASGALLNSVVKWAIDVSNNVNKKTTSYRK